MEWIRTGKHPDTCLINRFRSCYFLVRRGSGSRPPYRTEYLH